MADNVQLPANTGKVATREVTYSGETAQAQAVGLVVVSGDDDAKIATDVSAQEPLPTKDTGGADSPGMRILAVLQSPPGFDSTLRRARSTAVIESGTVTTVTTVTTVSTVTTVAGLTNIDGRNGSMLINQTNLSAWADVVRARIT